MILVSRLPDQSQINGMSGFPHSEIVGSKLAHSSPTLIAACHVLHRLYMPRHPRIALTSRLRVHTTNDNAGRPCGSPTRQSSVRQITDVDDINLSQIIRAPAKARLWWQPFCDDIDRKTPNGPPLPFRPKPESLVRTANGKPDVPKPIPPRHRF